MKNYLFGLAAFVLAVTFSAFTAPKVSKSMSTTDWYPVDRSTGLTTDDHPAFENIDKADLIVLLDNADCTDTGSRYCLVGADSAPAIETAASTFGADFRLKETATE